MNDKLLLYGEHFNGFYTFKFTEKFSYIVLNKAVYEKVVEMSTKRRQCRNNADVF